MARGERTENHPNRKVSRESLVTNNSQNIPSMVDGEVVYKDEPEAMPKKKGTGTVSATGANPVKVVSEARDLTPEENERFKEWVGPKHLNLQERYERMDRGINFPLGRN